MPSSVKSKLRSTGMRLINFDVSSIRSPFQGLKLNFQTNNLITHWLPSLPFSSPCTITNRYLTYISELNTYFGYKYLNLHI